MTKSKTINLFLAQVSQVNVKGQKYNFQIVSREETVILRAESIDEMNGWIVVLQEICSSLLNAGIKEEPGNMSGTDSLSRGFSHSLAADSVVEDEPDDSDNKRSDHLNIKRGISEFLLKNNYCADCSKSITEGSLFLPYLFYFRSLIFYHFHLLFETHKFSNCFLKIAL